MNINYKKILCIIGFLSMTTNLVGCSKNNIGEVVENYNLENNEKETNIVSNKQNEINSNQELEVPDAVKRMLNNNFNKIKSRRFINPNIRMKRF